MPASNFLSLSHEADEFVLYCSYAVPSIAKLLAGTGEFTERTQRSYDDTKLIISELVEHGYDSERGQRATLRMNQQHGRFDISNAELLYVLSTFASEPPRCMARYARRPMVEQEKLALFYFWHAVGQRMHIQAIPEGIVEFERFKVDYERQNFQYTEEGRRAALATRICPWAGCCLQRCDGSVLRPFMPCSATICCLAWGSQIHLRLSSPWCGNPCASGVD